MAPASENALIVQSDGSVLLDVHAPRAAEARATLAPFAELVKSPEHVHTYRLTPLSIWNARAAGLAAEQMVEALHEHARYTVPPNVEQDILELAARYGCVIITRDGDALRCTCSDHTTAERLARDRATGQFIGEYGQPGSNGLTLDREGRLTIDQHGNRRVVRIERTGARPCWRTVTRANGSIARTISSINPTVRFTSPIPLSNCRKSLTIPARNSPGVYRWYGGTLASSRSLAGVRGMRG